MREILFRGKRIDNGEWVEGLLARVTKDVSNIVNKEFDILIAVYTKTIGQFTGLCDKNGKKIFEGDIVEINNGQYCGEVRYGDGTSMFYIYQGESRSRPLLAGWSSDNSVEIIGSVCEGEWCD